MPRLRTILVCLALVGTACSRSPQPATTTPPLTSNTAGAQDPGFYLMLMWHQHQPLYPKDAAGVYTRPWVRVHATKDYWDMAALTKEFPDLRLTFNLTPVLLTQLEDLAGEAKDLYWVKSELPASSLSSNDKRFLLERFFDINPKVIARFPRLEELAGSRAASGIDQALDSWKANDFRDLQVLFNLAWTDPDLLAAEPLASLVARGQDFTEQDKAVVFDEHRRIIRDALAIHSDLAKAGNIEITTSPLAHPILPLLADSDLARQGDPAGQGPEHRFQEVGDAVAHVQRGLDVAERLLNKRPVGMWPGEGSVAQQVMSLFARNGVTWVASGEDVLARSLEIGSFERDANDLVTQPDILYQPWAAATPGNPPVSMFFRDVRLSDLIGFEYSAMPAEAAATDFMNRLRAIKKSIPNPDPSRPPVVSVILDGENAWENYPNDGKDFLRALYGQLSAADWVGSTTPSQYLARFASPNELASVWPGAWFQPNFATWIGEPEEATAWDYLYQTRQDLRTAERNQTANTEALAAGLDRMLFAEGSDWFWWYGSDQDSGNDAYFDTAYRELLGQVYDAIGQPRPSWVSIPIIPQTPLAPQSTPADLRTISFDGDPGDWEGVGRYSLEEAELAWVFDQTTLSLMIELPSQNGFDLFLGTPQGTKQATTPNGGVLGFGATHLIHFQDGKACLAAPLTAACETPLVAAGTDSVEIALPLAALGAIEAGDPLLAKLQLEDLVPAQGPMLFQVPDISNVAYFLEVDDPTGDDHGPGSYVYPTDGVFLAGSYDLTHFRVGTETDQLVIAFEVAAPLKNPWGSPLGFSVQTYDVYIDTDPKTDRGERLLLPGRNLSLPQGSGWEFAITVEGWQSAIFAADQGIQETGASFDINSFGDKGKLVIRIPLSLFGPGEEPSQWSFAAALMSQEGFPSAGVRRIRDVLPRAEQWKLGGAPNDANHTRVIDVAWPGQQEHMLGGYTPAPSLDGLGADDFGTAPILLGD